MEASRQRQADFFARIGVDEYVCRIGNEEYGVEDFFLLSVEDMARFGIDNVQAPTDYEQTDLTPFLEQGKNLRFIKLQ